MFLVIIHYVCMLIYIAVKFYHGLKYHYDVKSDPIPGYLFDGNLKVATMLRINYN